MKSTGEVMGIDYTYEAALAKAVMAAGLMLPPRGAILFSIADKDKAEALPILTRFYSIGYKIYATEGTAAMAKAAGIPVEIIKKKLGEGHPNVVDIVRQKLVAGVVNTTSGEGAPLRDGFEIRREAAEKRIPCFTSLDTVRAVVSALVNGDPMYNVLPLPTYLKGQPKPRRKRS